MLIKSSVFFQNLDPKMQKRLNFGFFCGHHKKTVDTITVVGTTGKRLPRLHWTSNPLPHHQKQMLLEESVAEISFVLSKKVLENCVTKKGILICEAGAWWEF